jgi:hypothetical protein
MHVALQAVPRRRGVKERMSAREQEVRDTARQNTSATNWPPPAASTIFFALVSAGK